MAIASLVLGILWIYWVGSVLAIIFGFIAKRQIRETGGQQGGSKLATAGIVLGVIGAALLVVFFIVGVVVALSGGVSTAGV